MIDFGDTYSADWFEVRDDTGTLGAAGTVTVVVTLPDASTASPSPTTPETGRYTFDLTTTQAGRHTFVVSATGGILGSATRKWSDSFDVRPADPGFIVSLADVKTHLGKTSSTDNEELRGFMEAATRVVEDDPLVGVGPVVVRSFTERHVSGRCLVLHRSPVVSLTSVVPWLTSGTTYAVGDLVVDPTTGIVERKNGGAFTGGPFAVTYRAGRVVVPSNVRLAALDMIRHWWESSQRGSVGRPGLVADPNVITLPSGYVIPASAAQLLAADRRAPGVA